MADRDKMPNDTPDDSTEDLTECPTEKTLVEADGLEAVETPAEVDDEGVEHVRITIRRAKKNRRLDKYVKDRIGGNTSRTALQRYIKDGTVRVNEKIVKPSYTIRTGDVIQLSLPNSKPKEIPPEDIPIDVIYEDEDILAVNKQTNLIIHPARGNWSGTLVNAVAYYFQHNWREGSEGRSSRRRLRIHDLPINGEVFRPGIVHRLDRDTTGVILIAKTELALYRLGYQFEHRKIQKTYTAIVHGHIPLDEDVIDMPIGKHIKFREKYAVHHDTGKPHPFQTKEAVTRYKVLERLAAPGTDMKFTLVELYPKTGRTHQLRVHMSHLGFPIVGDRMYGGGPLYRSQLDGHAEIAEDPIITRQALHAHTIEFKHPRTDEMVSITAPWKPDFEEALAELRKRNQSQT